MECRGAQALDVLTELREVKARLDSIEHQGAAPQTSASEQDRLGIGR